jgi:two-component sensor histidine kinase
VSRTTQEPACPSTSQNTLVSSVNWELVTNALHASAGLTGSHYRGQWVPGAPPIRIWLCSDDQRVLIQVWDSNDQSPVTQQPSAEAESGRGLWLVEMLSEDQGTYLLEGTTGKVVWASVTP